MPTVSKVIVWSWLALQCQLCSLSFPSQLLLFLEIVASLLKARPNCVENWAEFDLCHKPVRVL